MSFRNLLIGVALLGLSVGGAFMAGAMYGQRTALAAQSGSHGGPAGAYAAQGPGGPDQVVQVGPGAPGGPSGAAATFGTVSRVEGRMVYVTGADGKEVRVTLTDQTRIEKQAEGTVADLKAGTQVAVQSQGQAAADGSVTAATIALLPEGAARWEGRPPAR